MELINLDLLPAAVVVLFAAALFVYLGGRRSLFDDLDELERARKALRKSRDKYRKPGMR